MCKSCNSKKSNIGAISIDKIIADADLVSIGGTTLGVAAGELLHKKLVSNFENPAFPMFALGLAEIAGGVYGNSQAKSKLMQGFFSGLASSGTATIIRYSGIGLSGIWDGSFIDGIVENTRYRVGELMPVKVLPEPVKKIENQTVI